MDISFKSWGFAWEGNVRLVCRNRGLESGRDGDERMRGGFCLGRNAFETKELVNRRNTQNKII